MTSPTLNPQSVKKQTIVRSVQLKYVHVDPNGGTLSASLTMTLKLEYTSQTQLASVVAALPQLLPV
jgi:hypothetical protein